MPHPVRRAPLVAALAATLAVGAGLAALWRRRRGASRHAAAHAAQETDRENFDQTRSSGPAAMRDAEARGWDRIDEAIDESFPASDPPGY